MKPCLLPLVLVTLCGLASCDKVGKLVDKIRKRPSPTAPVLPSEPKVSSVVELSAAAYSTFISNPDKLVIIDFYADWCAPCRQLAPILEQVSNEQGGVVVVGKVNLDRYRELAAKEGVKSIPDVRLFRNGRQVDRFVGVPAESDLRRRIQTHVKGLSAFAPSIQKPAVPKAGEAAAGDGKPAEPTIRPMPKDWVPPSFERK